MNWTRVASCFLAIQSGLFAQTVQVVGVENEAGPEDCRQEVVPRFTGGHTTFVLSRAR